MAPKNVSFHFARAMADLERVESDVKPPAPGQVQIRVHACGLCHSDVFPYYGVMNPAYPVIPGHEVAGVVYALGEGVTKFKPGDRVAVGWFGGCCHLCRSCMTGDLNLCDKSPVTGLHVDGGYQLYMSASVEAVARIPDGLSFTEAAPLVCAGVTVYNSLRSTHTYQGATVGVDGIGGLGHLGIQFAAKMGYRVFAFSRGKAKEEDAKKLGAHEYFDTTEEGFAEKVQALGGVDVLLETSTSSAAANRVFPTLAKNGTFVILGVGEDKLQVDPGFMIGGRRKVLGFPAGKAADSEDTMNFAALSGVRSVNEVFPFEKVSEGFQRMLKGGPRFRVVVEMPADA